MAVAAVGRKRLAFTRRLEMGAAMGLLLAGLWATGVRGQDRDVRALLGLEDEWAAALVRRDAATFDRLLADGFVYTEDDRTSTRDAVLRDIIAGPDTVEAARNEDMRVHRFGTTAVVTGWLVVRGHGAGAPFERRYRFTDTWVRSGGRAGRWQIVAAHDYLAPAASR